MESFIQIHLFSFVKENQKTFLENYVFLNILYKS